MVDINMNGWNVEYEGAHYACLSMYKTNCTVAINGFTYKDAEYLCVHAINHDGQFTILNDVAWEFRFYKAG